MEKITMLSDENGEELEFYVLEQTKVNGDIHSGDRF